MTLHRPAAESGKVIWEMSGKSKFAAFHRATDNLDDACRAGTVCGRTEPRGRRRIAPG
jgi:hypothetical protein